MSGVLVSGPHCPVETDPPDPACAPRPVSGARLVAEASDGMRTEAVSDAEGRFAIEVPAGQVTITFQPVEGLMGTPGPIDLILDPDEHLNMGELVYDTGIR